MALTPEQHRELKSTGKVASKCAPRVIGIVGSRRRDTEAAYRKTRRAFLAVYRVGDTLVSGGCTQGGDRFAERLAACEFSYRVPITIHLPDESKLDRHLLALNARAAYAKINYARNGLIARDADILIAVVAKDRKGGTEDTVKKFKKKLGVSDERKLIAMGKLILV